MRLRTAANQAVHKDQLKAITARQLLERDFPDRQDIISPWLRTGETALIWAATGIGKTMLTLSLALAIAGGGRVWDWKAPNARKVLIVDGEMHLQDLRDRIEMLIDTGSVADLDTDALGENLSIIARQDQHPETSFYDIAEAECQATIYERCKALGAEVLIIDNLTTVADGLDDENEATAFRTVQGFMLTMKQAGIATILVHHARKDGQSPRGSTALTATFEAILGLMKPKVAPPGRAAFIARFDKFRAKGDRTMVPYRWVLEEDGWSVEEDQDDVLVETLNALQSLEFATQQELAEGLEVAKGTISKRLSKMVALEQVTKDGIKHYLGQAAELRRAEEEGRELNFDPDADPDDDHDEF